MHQPARTVWNRLRDIIQKEHASIGATFTELAGGIEDFRRTCKGNIRYPAMDILTLVTVSTICGYQKSGEIEDYGKHNRDWLCSVFGILPKHSPSDSTIQRVMKGISHESLAGMAGRLATELLRSETRTVAVDGKSMNSTSCDETGRHML